MDMTLDQHHEVVMDKLHDIDEDTDCILKEIGGNSMGEGFDTGALMGMLANKGVDPTVVAMLNDRCKDGNWGDGGMLIVLFLILILGFGNGGGFFGNRNGAGEAAGIDRTIFNQSNFENLANAISTQGTRQEMAINQLANNFNCTTGQIQMALAGLDKQLAVNQGSVVNAIQSCCCNIQNKIQDCCCQTNLNVERGFCNTNQNIQGLAYQIQTIDAGTRQLIQQSFCDQNAYLAQQFCEIKMREDQREIQALRDKNEELRATANTQAILTAIANRDAITFSGTAGATAFNGTGTIS